MCFVLFARVSAFVYRVLCWIEGLAFGACGCGLMVDTFGIWRVSVGDVGGGLLILLMQSRKNIFLDGVIGVPVNFTLPVELDLRILR